MSSASSQWARNSKPLLYVGRSLIVGCILSNQTFWKKLNHFIMSEIYFASVFV